MCRDLCPRIDWGVKDIPAVPEVLNRAGVAEAVGVDIIHDALWADFPKKVFLGGCLADIVGRIINCPASDFRSPMFSRVNSPTRTLVSRSTRIIALSRSDYESRLLESTPLIAHREQLHDFLFREGLDLLVGLGWHWGFFIWQLDLLPLCRPLEVGGKGFPEAVK